MAREPERQEPRPPVEPGEAEREWDEIVAESFPASDPPPGPTRLGPPRRKAA